MTTPISSGASSVTDLQSTAQQRQADFQSLAQALQSGDVGSAQQAFAQLQKDSPRLAQALGSPAASTDSPRIADMKTLAGALQSGDISGAQAAFAKLQQGAQKTGGHHHHHHSAPATATDDTTDPTSTVGSNLNTVA